MTPDRAEFDRVWPWLFAAMRGENTHTKEDLWRQLVEDPETLLWTAPRAAVVTELQRTPQKTIMHVWLAGSALGAMADVMGLLPAGEDWGRANGATEMTLWGRKGWERFLQHYGFGNPRLAVTKEL